MIRCPDCHCENIDDALYCGQCAHALHTQAHDDFVGKLINGRYLVKKKIAAGGMGEVYLATQTGIEQDVAIKKLYKHLYREDSIVRRFVNEARTYAKITHPNAVKIHDLLNVNGELCIIMEYVRGKTLTQCIKERYHFSQEQCLSIALQLADALGTAHQEGIIHRDLKTENIMLLETVPGRFSVKILDFGIAKIMGNSENMTEHGLIFGTPEFMSPEQAYGVDIDTRADIYAFGVLLYCMVAERLPFDGQSKLEILQKQVAQPPPKPHLWDGTPIDLRLEAIILKCLQKDKLQRYQSFTDVITDLTLLSRNQPLAIAHSIDKPKAVAKQSHTELPLSIHSGNEPEEDGADFSLHNSSAHPSVNLFIDDDDFEGDVHQSERDEQEHSPHDGEGLSLGELDLSVLDSQPLSKKSSHTALIVVLVLLLLAAAGSGVYFFVFQGTLPFLKDSPSHTVDSPPLPQAESPVQPSPATPPSPEVEPVLAPALPEIEEIPPSKIINSELFEYAVGMACMQSAGKKLYEGELNDSAPLLEAARSRLSLLDENERTELSKLEELKAKFEQILSAAQKQVNSQRYDCGSILSQIDTLDPSATGMGQKLRAFYDRCEKNRAAPPTTL